MKSPSSSKSTKQMAFTVKDGCLITFHFPTDRPAITGYLYGMDDFTWMVITPEGKRHIVHKAGVSIELHDEQTYEREGKKDLLDPIVVPFRKWIMENVFGQKSPEEREAVTA